MGTHHTSLFISPNRIVGPFPSPLLVLHPQGKTFHFMSDNQVVDQPFKQLHYIGIYLTVDKGAPSISLCDYLGTCGRHLKQNLKNKYWPVEGTLKKSH